MELWFRPRRQQLGAVLLCLGSLILISACGPSGTEPSADPESTLVEPPPDDKESYPTEAAHPKIARDCEDSSSPPPIDEGTLEEIFASDETSYLCTRVLDDDDAIWLTSVFHADGLEELEGQELQDFMDVLIPGRQVPESCLVRDDWIEARLYWQGAVYSVRDGGCDYNMSTQD